MTSHIRRNVTELEVDFRIVQNRLFVELVLNGRLRYHRDGVALDNVRKAMDALLSCGDVDLMEPSGNKLDMREESFVAPPESLSGMPLVFATYEGSGVVGSPTAGFAYFIEKSDTLVVISADRTRIRHMSQEQITQTVAMRVAQSLGASFLVHGTQVLCSIKGVSQTGETYGEAALRAILAFERAEESNGSNGGAVR